MIEVLSNPKKFFENLDSFGMKVPLLVIFVMAIPSAVIQYEVLRAIKPLLPPEMSQLGDVLPLIGIFSIIPAYIIMLIIFFIISGIIHLISGAFGGEGEFRKTATVVGYGLIPYAIVSYIQMAISIYSLSQAGEFASIQEFIAYMTDWNRIASSAIISAAGIVWSIAIWSHGIAVVRKIEFRKALISSAIPALLYLAYTIYTLYSLPNVGSMGGI
ncbi:MAG: YIP1 family protein [Archaeoglobi archaeon]|nr:YIP1 family protein [Archaeoglobi archaeon]